MKDLDLIPIINTKKEVVGVTPKSEILKRRRFDFKNDLKNIPVVIMAGGKGKRLMPHTNTIPKPLMPINNKSMIYMLLIDLNFLDLDYFL